MSVVDIKFPKIFHFPWSENLQNDDRMIPDVSVFYGKEVVVSLKIDGEGTGMTKNSCHARSLDSKNHPSRHWVKAFHSSIKNDIPNNFKIFGENCFAKHSIFYESLATYFYVFSIWENEICLSWDETKFYANQLGLITVPELYRGLWDEDKVKSCFTGEKYLGGLQEGYVCRIASSFKITEYQKSSSKMVRKDHVQTGEHWLTQPIIQNKLL